MNAAVVRVALVAAALACGSMANSAQPWLDRAWLVKVKPGPKRHFYTHGVERTGCSEADPCRTNGFVVPGDVLVASDTATLGAGTTRWVQVEYLRADGRSTTGWLHAVDLVALDDDEGSPSPQAWSGSWVRPEAAVTIRRPKSAASLSVEGTATWGASYPDRVRRGGVNTGQLSGIFTPRRSRGGFTMSGTRSLPFEAGDSDDCRVRFRLMLPYLLAEDNGTCGGLNVSFTGAYVRKAN